MAPPRKYATPEDMQAKIEEYFNTCNNGSVVVDSAKGPIKRQKPYTISGLCIYLGISRETWSEYSLRPEYKEICSIAKLHCEDCIVEGGLTGKLNPIMSIFILKNAHGYRDSVDIDISKPQEQLQANDVQAMLAERRLKLANREE